MNIGTGADILCRCLERFGVRHVFGSPGTQNVDLFEGLRKSSLRTIVPTSELAAGFMANGYYRASGQVGILTTIPGPGFTYAVPAIAEAAQDSAAILYIAGKPLDRGKAFDLQVIDQSAILRPLVKRIFDVEHITDLAAAVTEAYRATLSGEPGPVLLHVAQHLMKMPAPDAFQPPPEIPDSVDQVALGNAIRRIRDAGRITIVVGQGANDAAPLLQQIAELLQAPVVASRSAAGVIPEDHPLAISCRDVAGLNRMLDRSDLVLVIARKLGHNGSHQFQMRIERDKLIRVDSSAEVLKANHAASISLRSDARSFLARLAAELSPEAKRAGTGWTAAELIEFKKLLEPAAAGVEPKIHGLTPATPATLFAALREVMPKESCLVTDTGLHQVLASRHFQVLSNRGMIIPSDFQSMGFGLPAAIGAKLARPDRPVVAVIGDGSFVMSGMELLTAVRERIPLCVLVFNDGALGQIRLQQMSGFGQVYGTSLRTPNLRLFAQSVGAEYCKLNGSIRDSLRTAVTGPGVTLVEVEVADSHRMRMVQATGLMKSAFRRVAGPAATDWFKKAVTSRQKAG